MRYQIASERPPPKRRSALPQPVTGYNLTSSLVAPSLRVLEGILEHSLEGPLVHGRRDLARKEPVKQKKKTIFLSSGLLEYQRSLVHRRRERSSPGTFLDKCWRPGLSCKGQHSALPVARWKRKRRIHKSQICTVRRYSWPCQGSVCYRWGTTSFNKRSQCVAGGAVGESS